MMRNMRFSICCLIAIFLTANCIQAQELDFKVTVNPGKATKTDAAVFSSLETAIKDLVNNRDWIADEFQSDERIKGSIQLTITQDVTANSFEADLAIQATRPVYGSTYQTALLNHVDKQVRFNFEQFEPLIYTPNTFNDNLSSIISFYVFVILGMDYDTFSPLGGNPYFSLALEVVNAIPPQAAESAGGWTSLDGNRNRFWIIDNMLNPRIKPFRRAMYDYHRQGLDLMSSDTETGKATMITAIDAIQEVNLAYPNSMILQMFANTKAEEVIEIFKVGGKDQKTKISQLMAKIDPSRANKYRQLGR